MLKMTDKSPERLFQPCPLYEDGFGGRCKECLERQDCMMLTILGKLRALESKFNDAAVK